MVSDHITGFEKYEVIYMGLACQPVLISVSVPAALSVGMVHVEHR